MLASAIFEHITIAIVGSTIGFVCALPLARLLGRAIRRLGVLYAASQRRLILLPWRTAFASAMVIMLIPVFLMLRFGLGTTYGTAAVAGMTLLISLLVITSAYAMSPTSSPMPFATLGLFRTFATLSTVLATQYGFVGAGGIGFRIWTDLALLRYRDVTVAWLVITALALAIDMSIGLVQFLFTSARPELAKPQAA
jgi:ABC-type phosphate/phosphonate transport system permease subunit